MKIAEVKVSKTTCETTHLVPIPKGIVGATVAIEYTDGVWDNLRKTVVFRSYTTKDVLDAGDEVIVPAEVVARAGVQLYMGVYGVDADGDVIIPTVWASLGMVRSAAAPSGDSSTDPSLPVWAQIQGVIGDLDELDTTAKENLVAAVNEALVSGGGSGGETWELIKAITIPEGAEESNALTINQDENGNAFRLKKATLFYNSPPYTGDATPPNFSFFMLNGVTSGSKSPYAYTNGLQPPAKASGRFGNVEVALDFPGFQRETVARSNLGGGTYFGPARIEAVTSIGGANMLIYPGCQFWVYGVRA